MGPLISWGAHSTIILGPASMGGLKFYDASSVHTVFH